MHVGQTLDHAGLLDEAVKAADSAKRERGVTRTAIAEALEVSAAAISRALSQDEDPGRYAKLQRQIIEHLTEFGVVDETPPVVPVFRVVEQGERAA